jgi:hypothetical protein
MTMNVRMSCQKLKCLQVGKCVSQEDSQVPLMSLNHPVGVPAVCGSNQPARLRSVPNQSVHHFELVQFGDG